MKKIIFIFVIISFVLTISVFLSLSYLFETGSNDEDIEIYIPENASITKTISILNENDYLKPPIFFKFFIKFYSKYNSKFIYAGMYKITPNQTNLEIIKMLFNGGYDLTVKVTIPEGTQYNEIERIIFKNVELDTNDFRRLIHSDSIKSILGVPKNHSLEGYILPETYFFYKYSTPQYIVNKLVTEHSKFWNEIESNTNISQNNLKLNGVAFNKHKLLTLASIVEGETPLGSEAPTVAGLYLNRLKIGMLLQSDPTVQYANGSKSRVLYKDLEVNSRYNTYKYTGLPPGPINCPGKNAIKSTINFEENNYIYMVAYGDGSGRHRFARTLAEHNNNVALYRRARR